jgi:hypothetical protein
MARRYQAVLIVVTLFVGSVAFADSFLEGSSRTRFGAAGAPTVSSRRPVAAPRREEELPLLEGQCWTTEDCGTNFSCHRPWSRNPKKDRETPPGQCMPEY